MDKNDDFYMRTALDLAREAESDGEVPVGAVVVLDGNIVGEGYNCPIGESDPTSHAEITAIREAGKNTGNYRLTEALLYVTLEPCVMCYSAAVHARIAKIVYGASDPKGGIFSTGVFDKIKDVFNHSIEVESGILEKECSEILKKFFRNKR